MSVEARAAALGEYAEVARQWGEITGDPTHDDAATEDRRRQLEWWLGSNPNGEGVMAVVEEDGNYLGVAGWCPKTLLHKGEPLPVAEIGTTMTSPSARGRGVFSGLVNFLIDQARERGIVAIYGTPNEASGSIYIGRLNFVGIWPWARSIRATAPLVRLPFDALAAFGSGISRPKAVAGCEIVEVDEVAEASVVAGGDWGGEVSHLERTPEYLSWRYPSERYKVIGLRDASGSLVAWTALGESIRLGRPALVIADLVISEQVAAAGGWFVRSAIAHARSTGASQVLAFSMSRPGGMINRALREAGFLSRPSEMPLIAYAVDGDADLDSLFGKMAFIAGDSDTV